MQITAASCQYVNTLSKQSYSVVMNPTSYEQKPHHSHPHYSDNQIRSWTTVCIAQVTPQRVEEGAVY